MYFFIADDSELGRKINDAVESELRATKFVNEMISKFWPDCKVIISSVNGHKYLSGIRIDKTFKGAPAEKGWVRVPYDNRFWRPASRGKEFEQLRNDFNSCKADFIEIDGQWFDYSERFIHKLGRSYLSTRPTLFRSEIGFIAKIELTLGKENDYVPTSDMKEILGSEALALTLKK